jgi:hypothetical protein
MAGKVIGRGQDARMALLRVLQAHTQTRRCYWKKLWLSKTAFAGVEKKRRVGNFARDTIKNSGKLSRMRSVAWKA